MSPSQKRAVGRRLFGDAAPARPPAPVRPVAADSGDTRATPTPLAATHVEQQAAELRSPLARAPREEDAERAEKRPGPGRPPVHSEPVEKTTVVLRRSNLVFLDRTSVAIRAVSGTSLRRSEVIRALVDALEQSGFDLTQVESEVELRDIIRRKLGGKQ